VEKTGNHLFDSLQDSPLQTTILRAAKRVTLLPGDGLCERGKIAKSLFFLTQGVASSSVRLGDKTSCEVGLVGAEGLIGYEVLFDEEPSRTDTKMQSQGSGLCVPLPLLTRLFTDAPGFRERVLSFASCQSSIASQTIACAMRHSAEQRIVRWLLQVSDRIQSDTIRETQQGISERLNVTRPHVSLIVHKMQRQGLLRSMRGTTLIADRRGLESRACECYGVCRAEIAGLTHDFASRRKVPNILFPLGEPATPRTTSEESAA